MYLVKEFTALLEKYISNLILGCEVFFLHNRVVKIDSQIDVTLNKCNNSYITFNSGCEKSYSECLFIIIIKYQFGY